MDLQEAQRENVFLRAQFAERTDCVALEKAEAERRLGAVEAETRRLTDSLKETCERHAEEMKKQEERVCAGLKKNAFESLKPLTWCMRSGSKTLLCNKTMHRNQVKLSAAETADKN